MDWAITELAEQDLMVSLTGEVVTPEADAYLGRISPGARFAGSVAVGEGIIIAAAVIEADCRLGAGAETGNGEQV